MPFKTKQKKATVLSNELPQNLAHKPVYALPYEHYDGFYKKGTDARYISVGLAQYSPYDVSVKIFRHTGDKWTRLSEELPLHRIIDAVNFLAKVVYDSDDGNVTITSGTFENQTEDVEITRENRAPEELASFYRFLGDKKELVSERFNELYELLAQLKQNGKF